MNRHCLIFVVSDFMGSSYRFALQRIAHRHEVIPVVISDPMESKLPDLGFIAMEDCKGQICRVVDTRHALFQKNYEAQFEERLAVQKDIFVHAGLSCVRISTTDEVLKPIVSAFGKRIVHV